MIIATLREVKDNENRVGLTPHGVKALVDAGHTVIVERQAGWGSGFPDSMYEEVGANLRDSAYDIVQRAELIVKIKEPVPAEYYWLDLFRGKTLFTYLHLSGVDPKLTDKLIENNITAIAYETVAKDGGLPLLAPMSQVAGVLACQYGAHYLQKKHGGVGVSLGHIDGADHALTLIMGAGFVGRTAAVTAGGMGGDVVLLDINPQAIERAKDEIHACLGPKLSRNVTVQVSNQKILEQWVKKADLLIGAVLIPGAKAPQVVSEKMIHSMKRGAVIVDVAIDQGGCIWGSQPTSHRHPIYDLDGKIYCCIPNMPGQVAHQSTQALTSATLPYILEIAEVGSTAALKKNQNLRKGLNAFGGKITYESVARDLKLERLYVPPEKLLSVGADTGRAQRSIRKTKLVQRKSVKRA
ncbi:alanine dehydrogenase [Candidatus Peregrinibacteria bacterium]|nr:alanine dehydrogenase [Candidatus Peregrinibacteria bacterium]